MNLSQARLIEIARKYSYRQIQDITGIPVSTISYVVRGVRKLPERYKRKTRNAYQRTVYANLREQGLSPTQARRWSWYSPPSVTAVVSEVSTGIDKLVDYRFEKYKDFLQRTEQFISDTDVRTRLRNSISESLAKSDIPSEDYDKLYYGSNPDR